MMAAMDFTEVIYSLVLALVVFAFLSACRLGVAKPRKLHLDRGAEADLRKLHGWITLMSACYYGHTEAAKPADDRGAEVDLPETDRGSALRLACKNGQMEIAERIINREAEVDLQNADGWTALMLACQHGHPETVELLLVRGAEVNMRDTKGWTALMRACDQGHTEAAKRLLDHGAEVDLQDTNGWTALISACSSGYSEAAELLLNNGAEVNMRDTYGCTALMRACDRGYTEVAKLLLDYDAEADLQNNTEGWTALMAACDEGHTEAAKLLLDRGAEVDLHDDRDWTALMYACMKGRVDAAQVLLDRGAKVNLQDTNARTALMFACRNGYVEVAQMLLDRGAGLNMQKADGSTALILACAYGHLEPATLLLDHGAGVNMQAMDGSTALMSACSNDNVEAAQLLLDRGAEVDLQMKDGWTALLIACLGGHLEPAKLLLDRGAEVDLQKTNGETGLMLACLSGHSKVVKLLLDRGAKVNLQNTAGQTALMQACEKGHQEAVKLLLEYGAEVDIRRADGRTALMLACHHGHPEAAMRFLDRGAKVDLQESKDWTALMLACEKGHQETVKLLLDRGAEVDVRRTDGWTALMLACYHGHSEAAKLLLDRGAKADLLNTAGRTALMLACEKGHQEAVKLLLEYGAEVDIRRADGRTALIWACRNGHTETAEQLLDRGAKVDLQDTKGWTALMMACEKGHQETVKLLLERGAEVDVRMTDGWTALMSACKNDHREAAKLLLDRGAEVDRQRANGWTALMWACLRGHSKVVTLLLDRGARVSIQDEEGRTALAWATRADPDHLGRAEMDRRSMSIITLLCTRSKGLSFADLDGPVALATARKNGLDAIAELLEFLSESSPLAPYGLPLRTLASFYARNVRTLQAAAELSGPELYFMGLKDTKQRHEAMARLRAASQAEQPGDNSLDTLSLKIEQARDAHKRGQDSIDCNLEDVQTLLASRPCQLAASEDFNVAMDTLCDAKKKLEDLQVRVADDANLVDERDLARDKLICLLTATTSGVFRSSMQRLEQTCDPEAVETICSRVWASFSEEPLASPDDQIPSDQDAALACQAADAAITAWKQREEVILARSESDAAIANLEAAAQSIGPEQTFFLFIRHPKLVQRLASEIEAVKDAFRKELRALRDNDPMDEAPLAEIRCALELIARRGAEARQIELVRCRAAAHAMKTEVDELVSRCSKPSTTAVEGLIDQIDEVQYQRAELELKIRHARGRWARVGGSADADTLAKLEDELANLPSVYKLDRELRRERVRVIRHAERYFPKLMDDSEWREQIGLSSGALIGVGKLELWLANVTRADFARVKELATKPGKEVYKVTDPDGREMVLKSFHLANDSWHSRFYRQVQELAELKSAYLVHVEALFVDASFGCILMPFYAGGDLAAWIRDNPHASDETRKRIAVGVLSGVHALHQRNLVHRDIKPENIFLTEALTPVLGDFDGVQIADVTMTQPLQTTVRYVAPELRAGGVCKVAPAVDVFSVGVVLGEIFVTPSAALQNLIDKLQADDPSQRPSAIEALRHEAFHAKPMRSCKCLICLDSYPAAEGVCCERDHFACRSCLGAAVRAASQPDAQVQLRPDCSMPCVAPECGCELPGSDLAAAVPEEFQTLLQIVREHFERETAAGVEKEIQRRLNEALREQDVDPTLREHIEHIQNRILTLSCPRCETAFVDFDGCCALQCSNSSCACFFCAWCLQSQGGSDACHAHIARCSEKPSEEADLFYSEHEVVKSAWCKLRAARLREYVRDKMSDLALRAKVYEMVQPLLTEDLVGPGFTL